MDYPDDEGLLIHPEDIKQEEDFMHCDEQTNPADLSDLLKDLKFLEDTVLKAEIKLGEIVDKWQNYFEDATSCNFNLMLDWLLSIKSSLDEITQKYRTDLAPPLSPPCQDFCDELPLKYENLPGHDHGREQRSMRTRPRKPVSSFTSPLTGSSSSSSSSAEEETYSDGAPSDLDDDDTNFSPQSAKKSKSPVKSKRRPKNSEKPPKRNKSDLPSRQKAECPYCHKILATPDGLKSHVQLKHEPDQLKFRCTLCPRGFDRKGQLASHLLTHSGTKTYICETCGWSFYQYTNLVQHMRKHSDDRPLKCDQCEETFKYPQSLKSHVQTKHSSRGNQCSECGKMFPTEARLKRHEAQVHQTVRKYPCPHCEKGFKRPDHLKYHLKTHRDKGGE